MNGHAVARRRSEHNYVNLPAQLEDVLALARRGLANTGNPQWIHMHPQTHACDHRCYLLGDPPASIGGL